MCVHLQLKICLYTQQLSSTFQFSSVQLLSHVRLCNPMDCSTPGLSVHHQLLPAVAAKSLQSCPTLCDPIDSNPRDSPIPGILQARTLEWVAISFSNAWKWKVKVKTFSCVRLLAMPGTAAYQALLSLGFSRQEYWSAYHCLLPPTPRVYSNSCSLSRWCHPAISSSVVPFSSCPQSLPASESFPMSQLFAWGGQSTGVSALASFLPKKSQGWSPLEWTDWISLQSKGLSRVFSNTTVQKHQFFGAQLSS